MPASSAEVQDNLLPDFPDDPFSEPIKSSPYLQRNDNVAASTSSDYLAAWAKTTRFNVLNHFSQVTNVARNGAHNLLSTSLFQGIDSDLSAGDFEGRMHGLDRRRNNQRTSLASLATSFLQHGPVGPFGPSDPSWKHSELAKKSGTGEYDSARVYLAKWAKQVAEDGEANRKREGEESRQKNVSKLDAYEESILGPFEIWDLLPCIDRPEASRVKGSGISQEAWSALFDERGAPTVSFNHMRQLVFQHGYYNDDFSTEKGTDWEGLGCRAECWSFLLGAQNWSMESTKANRKVAWEDREKKYSALIDELIERTSLESENFWKEQRHRIRVDCLRVDKKLPFFEVQSRQNGKGSSVSDGQLLPANEHVDKLQNILLSYVVWDREEERKTTQILSDSVEGEIGLLGGYVQGMSDLCAPLYSLCQGDESKTFWLFVGLMQRIRSNFYIDQSGMKMQLTSLQKLIGIMDPTLHSHLEKADSLNLFFCFRWLLISFKREFGYPDILRLWEAIFCASFEVETQTSKSPYHGISDYFQLFIAFAILEHHRDIILKYLANFDELLQYMNGLSHQIDVDTTLQEAEVLCLSLQALFEQRQNNIQFAVSPALPDIDDNLKTLITPNTSV